MFCAKTNNTLFDTSDDVTRTWTDKFKNQDGTSYDVYQVYALTEDMDGDIWVGTNIGVFVIDNPEKMDRYAGVIFGSMEDIHLSWLNLLKK